MRLIFLITFFISGFLMHSEMMAQPISFFQKMDFESGLNDDNHTHHYPGHSISNFSRDDDSNNPGKNLEDTHISNKYRSDKREYRYVMQDRLHHRICVSGLFQQGLKDFASLWGLSESIRVQPGSMPLFVEKRE